MKVLNVFVQGIGVSSVVVMHSRSRCSISLSSSAAQDTGSQGRVLLGQPHYSWGFHQYSGRTHTNTQAPISKYLQVPSASCSQVKFCILEASSLHFLLHPQGSWSSSSHPSASSVSGFQKDEFTEATLGTSLMTSLTWVVLEPRIANPLPDAQQAVVQLAFLPVFLEYLFPNILTECFNLC